MDMSKDQNVLFLLGTGKKLSNASSKVQREERNSKKAVLLQPNCRKSSENNKEAFSHKKMVFFTALLGLNRTWYNSHRHCI